MLGAMMSDVDAIRDMIRAEFQAAFAQLGDHEKRLTQIELWRMKEEGFKEGAGSIHSEVKDLRVKVSTLEASLSEVRTQAHTVGSGVPWVIGAVGGLIGILVAIGQLVVWLNK